MNLRDYFQSTEGTGIISTSDRDGMVNSAIYSRPYVIDDKTVVFIMADRLTRKNLMANPRAAFLFLEDGEGFAGKRLVLTMTKQGTGEDEKDTALTSWYEKYRQAYPEESLYLGYFRIDETMPLVEELGQAG
jgi:hypothetical protein